MNQTVGKDMNPARTPQEQMPHGEAAEHGHSGEGVASVMAHLISQGEKQRRQDFEGDDERAGGRHL